MKKNVIVVTGMMIGIQPLTLLYNPGTWLLADRLFGKLQIKRSQLEYLQTFKWLKLQQKLEKFHREMSVNML